MSIDIHVYSFSFFNLYWKYSFYKFRANIVIRIHVQGITYSKMSLCCIKGFLLGLKLFK